MSNLLKLIALLVIILLPFSIPYVKPKESAKTLIRTSHRGSVFQPNFYKEIYEEKDDIDILLLESSQIQFSLDYTLIQKLFLKSIERPLKIVRLKTYQQSSEILALLAQEILERRKVKLIVLELQNANQSALHTSTCLHSDLSIWIQHLSELDNTFKFNLFACSILSGMRNLYTHLDANIFPQTQVGNYFQTVSKDDRRKKYTQPATPDNLASLYDYVQSYPIEDFLFSSSNLKKIKVLEEEPDIEGYFVRKIIGSAKQKGSLIVGVRPPIRSFFNGKVTLNKLTQQVLALNHIPIIGLTPKILLGTTYALALNDIFMSPTDWHTNHKGTVLSTLFYHRAFSRLLSKEL